MPSIFTPSSIIRKKRQFSKKLLKIWRSISSWNCHFFRLNLE